MRPSFQAWGDESVRLGDNPPVYLLGAAIASPSAYDEIREALRAIHSSGPKLHWRDLDNTERQGVVRLVARFDIVHVIVVGSPVAPRTQERVRAMCLERLAWELYDDGVEALTLEARPSSLMSRDLRTIDALRGKRALPGGLRVDHGVPSAEPMLWIADQVLGAFGESLSGRSRLFDELRAATRIVRIGA